MAIGLIDLYRRLNTTSTGLFLVIADNDSGVASIAVTAPGGSATSLTITYPGGTLARKEYQLGTRVTFSAVSFTSTPQIAVNQVLHVIARTATTVDLATTPLIPGETPPTAIQFTDTGTGTIRDLNAVETVAGELSECYRDFARYEKDLSADLTPNERPAWTMNAVEIGVANAASGDTSTTKRAIAPLGPVATFQPDNDVAYTALIYIESDASAGTAVNTPFDTNGIVHHIDDGADTMVAGVANSIRTEYSLIPV